MKVTVIDFETTGIPSDDHPAAIVEAGFYNVAVDEVFADVTVPGWQSFVRTRVAVDIPARAVHHITDAEIATGIPAEHALTTLMDQRPDYFCAHNAEFEQNFFSGGGTPWLDTFKIGLRLWPDAPAHSNQVLRYWLGLVLPEALAMPPHRALPDCYVTANILKKQIETGTPLSDLAAWSKQPALLVKVGFGKHRGKAWADVDSGYLKWCLDQDMDKAVKHTARHHLKLRDGKR